MSHEPFTYKERSWLHAAACDYVEGWRDECALTPPDEYVPSVNPIVYNITQYLELPDGWFPSAKYRPALMEWLGQSLAIRHGNYLDQTIPNHDRLVAQDVATVIRSIQNKVANATPP